MSMNMDVAPLALRVAGAIRAEMAWQKLSGVALAAHLDLSAMTVSKRMNGQSPFDLAEFEKVAEWLGLTPSELLSRADREVAA